MSYPSLKVGDVVVTSRKRSLYREVPEGVIGTIIDIRDGRLQLDWHTNNTVVKVVPITASYSTTPHQFKDNEGNWRSGVNWDEENFILFEVPINDPSAQPYTID